jgi:phenylpropionate dioxygenase-like ring-hydroxylating dioxygenase large terminal subunit
MLASSSTSSAMLAPARHTAGARRPSSSRARLGAAARRPARVVAAAATTTTTTPATTADAQAAAAAYESLLGQTTTTTTAAATTTPTSTDNKYAQYATEQRPGYFKAWWPIAAVENLDPSVPNALELMGEKLVAWQRADGEWVVQADRCPHRLAPMSDGFVSKDKTQIVCAYHGYGFCGKSGSCTRVPAAAGGVGSEAERRAMAGRRAALRTLPAREEAGVLFVWPDPYSADSRKDAAAAPPPPVPKELRGDKFAPLSGRWYERELPHSWDFFIENVADPMHAPQAHSGVAGFDAAKADRLQVKLVPGEDGTAATAITPQGFTLQTLMEEPGRRGSFIHFHAPSLVRYEPAPLDDEAAAAAAQAAAAEAERTGKKAEARPGDPAGKLLTHLIFYSAPVRPGWCKLIGTSFIVDAETGEPSKAASIFTTALPTWLRHVLGHEFMAGDLYILSRAATAYAQEGRRWRSSYWMPTSADAGIVALRRWMETFGGGADVPVLPASAAGAGVLAGSAAAAGPAAAPTTTTTNNNNNNFALPGTSSSNPLSPPEAALAAASREQILSRYEQHTRNCAACRAALGKTRAAAAWSARLAAFAAGAAVLIAAAAAQHAAAVALSAASAAAASASKGAAVAGVVSAGLAERAAAGVVGATGGLGGPVAVVAALLLLAVAAWLVRSGARRLEQAFISLPFDRASKAFV